MSQMQEISYLSADGIHTVQGGEWQPDGTPRGVVQIVHGVAEHIGRYEHVAQFLNQQGYVVCGQDHLGHGHTAADGIFGYFAPRDGWNLVVQDIRHLREQMGAKYPNLPYVMLGHSMGSFLTRTYLIRYPGTLDGAILSGTGQEAAPLVAGGQALAKLLCFLRGPKYVSSITYRLSLGGYNRFFRKDPHSGSWLSRDEERVKANRKDPLCSFRPTVSMFRDMLGGIQFIGKPSNVRRMDPNLPLYLFSGDRDPVGNMGKGVQKVAELFRQAGCQDVTVKLYPGGRHEMLNEINRQEVMEDLLAWLEEKVVLQRKEISE
ncbi:MAG: lysophospholipase [Lawsonibacter sp.]|jgi:alpha-beta hydrolase superfamily lysophospholipase